MKLCVIGTGYVGLVSGACLADAGNQVWCVDKDAAKVARLNRHEIPIYEPGLEGVVERNEREGRLRFTTDLKAGLDQAEICFITVDTPPDGDGRADLTNVLAVARSIGELMTAPKIIVTKSTVPVGTTLRVKQAAIEALQRRGVGDASWVQVASNPEFLKEGNAVNDFMKPDRVVVGVESQTVGEKLHALYQPFMHKRDRFLPMDIASAELTKYAANAMLATRISFMNELARLCEKVGADISAIREGLGRDPRIGPDFLYAGLGYGGSCFPKDMQALAALGREYGVPLAVIDAADAANLQQRKWFWEKIAANFGGERQLRGKRFAVWGVAFKANTDDVRMAPSIFLMQQLLRAGAAVTVFDPVANETGKSALGADAARVQWCANNYDCLEGADALVICTEWREFRSPDFVRMKERMKSPIIFDGRLLYHRTQVEAVGFQYITIGR